MSYDVIRAYLASRFAGHAIEESAFERGSIHELNPRFRVARVSPDGAGPWLYASIGAFEGDPAIELYLLAPKANPQHVEAVATAAYFHAFYGLAADRTMKVGRWWLEGHSIERFWVTPGPELGDAGGVRYYRLVPLLQDEADYLERAGAEALRGRLARADLLDFYRGSVV